VCNLISTLTIIEFTVSKRARDDDDSIDVDEEGGGDTEEDEPAKMSVDEDEGDDSTPKKSKKASKLKPRKPQLNVEAFTQEQAILPLTTSTRLPSSASRRNTTRTR